MRYFLEIAYKGTHFAGWQIQENAYTIQAEIEQKLSWLLKQKTIIMGSGRTDAGVHATQQIAHFDTDIHLDISHLQRLNKMLHADITIQNIHQVADQAHARFDADRRSYQYHITTQKNPFSQELALYLPLYHHLEKMQEAAKILLEYNDFQCFSKVKTDVNNFNCKIFKAYFEVLEGKWIFHISANRFLRGMVRAIVGTLLEVGKNKISVDNFRKIIENKNRQNAGQNVSPVGLYLSEVHYPYSFYQSLL